MTETTAKNEKKDQPEGADTRDTAKGGVFEEAREKARKELNDTKVVRRFADGSSEWTTVGALEGSHGAPMGGPTVADLNPAFAENASTHAGAVE